MNELNIILQKINLAININSEFLKDSLPAERMAFLHGRIAAYKHTKEMTEEFIKEQECLREAIK